MTAAHPTWLIPRPERDALPWQDRNVLGIETSCDETAAAVVTGGCIIRSSVVASQYELHAEYRGVVPEIASRAHAERLVPIVQRAVAEAGVPLTQIDAIAIGHRPGLIGSLLVGVAGAKGLALALGVPLVGVDHIQAHLYAGLMAPLAKAMGSAGSPGLASPAPADQGADATSVLRAHFPAIGLVVSGGHTTIFRVDRPNRMDRIGWTIDDAIGEAYDKVASMLGLPMPGGPAVDKLARTGNPKRFAFPISRLNTGAHRAVPGRTPPLNVSFSGLKTAVKYALDGVPNQLERYPAMERSPGNLADLCASFQYAAAKAIVMRLKQAFDNHPDCRTLLVGGGVTANSHFRAEVAALGERLRVALHLPELSLCVDNGAMIAGLGHQLLCARAWQSDGLDLTAHPSGSEPAQVVR